MYLRCSTAILSQCFHFPVKPVLKSPPQPQNNTHPAPLLLPSPRTVLLFSSHNITKERNNAPQNQASTPCSRTPACPAASPCPRRDSRSCHQPCSDSGSLHTSWHAWGGSWPVFFFFACRGSKTCAPGEPGTSSSTGCIRPVWAIALHDEPLSPRFQQLRSTTTIRIYKSRRRADNSPFQAERSGFTCRAARWHWAAPSCTRHHRMSPGQILPYSLGPAALVSETKLCFYFLQH